MSMSARAEPVGPGGRHTDVETRLSRPVSTVLLAAALIATAAGCARPATTGVAGAPAAAPTATPAPCSSRTPAASGVVTLTEADTGSTVCLSVGQRVEVYLHGTLTDRWETIIRSGDAVSPAPSGKGTLAIGVTGGFFVARAPGDARLSSSRPACTPSPATSPCAGDRFTVDIRVR